MKKRGISLLLALSMVFLLVACGGDPASTSNGGSSQDGSNANQSGGSEPDEVYTLKFNHVLTESEPFHAGFLAWADAVKERTNGGLIIEVYPGGQLGVEEDIIEQLRNGANVGQNTDAARLGMYVEGIAVMNGPYFIDTLEEMEQLKESPTIQAYIQELEENYGIKVLSFSWCQTHRHFFTNKPINTPDDLAGLRIRTPGSPIWQESIRALGAEPVSMNFGDMYTGLQQGAIDGAELVYANIPGAKLYDVLKYANETSHILLLNFEVVSAEWFNSLPEEYQEILVEECDKAGLAASQEMQNQIEETKQVLIENNMTINTDCDIDAIKAAGETAYEVLGLTEIKEQIWEEIGKS